MHKAILKFCTFVLAASWWLGGCRKDLPPRDQLHVVILGSSTAAGLGPANPLDSWASRYERYLKQNGINVRLTNLAASGYVSYQLMPTGYLPPFARPFPDPRCNITKALKLLPHAIIINLPSNDTDAGYGLEEQLRNLKLMSEMAQEQGVKVWITTTQPRMFYPDQVRRQEGLRDSIYETFGNQAIDFWSELGDCAGWPLLRYDSGDGVHLNGAAHGVFFERVKEKEIPKQIRQSFPTFFKAESDRSQ